MTEAKGAGYARHLIRPSLPPQRLRNIRAIGECIYCGGTDHLTREHVVPRGMRGTVTLPKGSCIGCARTTRDIETKCMRDTLIHVRVKHGLHNTPTERPKTFPIILTSWSGEQTIRQIPADDYPTLWAMPIYEYPGILLDIQPEATNFGLVYAHQQDRKMFQDLLKLPGVKSVTATSGGVEVWVFARWIAKIAYCYAVANLGLDKVRSSPLKTMIIDGSNHPNYLVGGLNQLDLSRSQDFRLEPPRDEIFSVDLREVKSSRGTTYLAVYVRLLSFLQGASYIAVIGEQA